MAKISVFLVSIEKQTMSWNFDCVRCDNMSSTQCRTSCNSLWWEHKSLNWCAGETKRLSPQWRLNFM